MNDCEKVQVLRELLDILEAKDISLDTLLGALAMIDLDHLQDGFEPGHMPVTAYGQSITNLVVRDYSESEAGCGETRAAAKNLSRTVHAQCPHPWIADVEQGLAEREEEEATMTMPDNPRDDFLTLACHAHTCPACSGLWGHDNVDCCEDVVLECEACINAYRQNARAERTRRRGEGKKNHEQPETMETGRPGAVL